MDEIVKGVFDKFDRLLRSTFPGIVGAGAMWLVDPSLFPSLSAKWGNPQSGIWTSAVIGIAAGLVLYSIHILLLENLMVWLAYLIVRQRYRTFVPAAWSTLSFNQISKIISRERWCRRARKLPDAAWRAGAIQENLDRVFGWQIFTYCTSWALLLVAIVGTLHPDPGKVTLFVVLGSFLATFLCAFVSDVQTTAHEVWLSKEYPLSNREDR